MVGVLTAPANVVAEITIVRLVAFIGIFPDTD